MPIYQYHCRNCGANIEKMQSVSAAPLVECPECHHPTLQKVLQPAGIIFKGSGWYVTDSRKSSASSVSSGDGEKAATPTESKSETKGAEPAKSATD